MFVVLPPLPYAYNALEPYIDARTMEIHYAKHQQAYVDQLNKALADEPKLAEHSVRYLLEHSTELPERVRVAVRNHGGGVENHTFFWNCMKPYSEVEAQGPVGPLAKALEKTFGSFEAFKEQFNAAALSRFGSGWAWLVYKNGTLSIVSTANQDSPVLEGYEPLLGLDVWEHAYYLQYQNRRTSYVENWWKLVNWPFVATCYAHAIK